MEKMTEAEVKAFNEGYRGGLADAQQEVDRDYFAVYALTGELAAQTPEWSNNDFDALANRCYRIADAMLKARLQVQTRES